MTRDRSRVLVLGTGAMASLVGARLARTGRAAVTLAGTWPAALDAIARHGITLVSDETAGDGDRAPVPVAVRRLSDDLGRADLVLVLVKSARTAAVAPHAARALAQGGIVLTLQNGLGNDAVLARAAGSDRVAVGVTSMGATLLGPGRVRPGGPGLTVLGASGPAADAVRHAAALFRAAGFETELTADIERLVWRKLAVNCAINPLSALLGVPNGALLEHGGWRATLEAAAREVGAVARAAGGDLAADPVALAVEVAERTAANHSSMLQDLQRGTRTEVDAINGAVVREGRRLGVATPVNDDLWRRVRAREGRPVSASAPTDAAPTDAEVPPARERPLATEGMEARVH